ncbi:MAG: tetratricopeptide repeat protein [Burkholderiales bacterium]
MQPQPPTLVIPPSIDAGLHHHRAGRLPQAEAIYWQVLQTDPGNSDALHLLGVIASQMKKFELAVELIERALSIKPGFAEALSNCGNALQELKRYEEALANYDKALSIKPEIAEVLSNRGNALKALGRFEEALESYDKALAIRPDNAEAHNNRGIVLKEQGKLAEAIACYQKALALKPNYDEAHFNLGLVWKVLGKLDESLASYRRALALKPDNAEVHSNLLFTLNYHPEDHDEEILAQSLAYDARFGQLYRAAWPSHSNSRDADRRLKVGYVSPDFRRHAAAYFAEPILAHHDRQRVETFCYSETRTEDDYTAHFKAITDHWHSTVGMSDDAMAQLIQKHQIDILVDLAGHSASNRLRVFARKPAPIQVTYLGYPATTGLSAMDYRLTDRHTDAEGVAEARYVERLVRLPDSMWCYRPAADMPEVSPLPALARGFMTYGSFNNFNKIDRPTIELWAAMLRDQPSARLMLLTIPESEVRQILLRGFAEQGIDAARLIFHGRLSNVEFHRAMLEADIALDPVTVNGGTTTCESLWMGVPVISLTGTRFLSRAGLSILNTIGMQDLAAATTDDYLRIATRLAGNLPQLANMRATLRTRMQASPLMDEARFTRGVEAAYREMFAKWAKG